MMFGPNGSGLLKWLLDNIPALVAALTAAGVVLSRHRRRNFWVWLFAVSAFIYTFLTEVSSKNSDNHGQSDNFPEAEGRP